MTIISLKNIFLVMRCHKDDVFNGLILLFFCLESRKTKLDLYNNIYIKLFRREKMYVAVMTYLHITKIVYI